MTLREYTRIALAITAELETILSEGRLMQGTKLLDGREAALAAFAEAYANATDRDRNACREMIAELVAADESLQSLAGQQAEAASTELSRSPSRPTADATTSPACLDKRA